MKGPVLPVDELCIPMQGQEEGAKRVEEAAEEGGASCTAQNKDQSIAEEKKQEHTAQGQEAQDH